MKTVFIIGAGASKEIQLPTGAELKHQIATVLDINNDLTGHLTGGDETIAQAFRGLANVGGYHEINDLLRACRRIRDAMPEAISIDNFLDSHADDKTIELCGKLAIVRTILSAEASSAISRARKENNKLNFHLVEDTWFNGFMKLLTEGCRRPNLEQRLSSVILVIFNYDRCVEHYIYHSFQNYYGMRNSEAMELLKRIEIYHPYGTVGSLPFDNSINTIEYGAIPHVSRIVGLTAQIKTFTEGTDSASSDIEAIRRNMQQAKRVVFLGFAFHPMNMELLLPKAAGVVACADKKVFATAFGLSISDIHIVSAELATRGGMPVENVNLHQGITCSQLFQEYRRSLSFT